jgi:putative ABC transport system permease protein
MIGISAIFIFASFGFGLYGYVNEVAESSGIDKFMVQVRGMSAPGLDDTFSLGEKDFKAVKRTQGVKEVTAWYMKPAAVEKDKVTKYVYMAGILPGQTDIEMLEDMMGVEIESGRQLRKDDSGRAVLGYNYKVPDKIFARPYRVGDRIKINGENFDVIGFFESVGNPQDDSNVYIMEDDIFDLFGSDTPYAMIIGSAANVDKIDDTVERVERNLRRTRNVEEGKEDFQVQTFQDALEMFTSVIDIVVGFIFLIVIISAIVASINTANTMVTSVLERIQEIGIMKSIGSTNNKIRDIFLLESSFLGLAAGVFGVLVGWGLSAYGGKLLEELGWGFLSPNFPWYLFVGCVVLATLVGSLSGVFPAIYASKQNVVDALRYE